MSQPAVPQEMPAPAVSQTETGLRASWALPVTNEGTGGAPIEAFVVYMRREDEAVPAAGVDMGLATEYEAPNLLANYRYTFAVRAPPPTTTTTTTAALPFHLPPVVPCGLVSAARSRCATHAKPAATAHSLQR